MLKSAATHQGTRENNTVSLNVLNTLKSELLVFKLLQNGLLQESLGAGLIGYGSIVLCVFCFKGFDKNSYLLYCIPVKPVHDVVAFFYRNMS